MTCRDSGRLPRPCLTVAIIGLLGIYPAISPAMSFMPPGAPAEPAATAAGILQAAAIGPLGTALDRFDAAVSAGLPAALSMPYPASTTGPRPGSAATLRIDAFIDGEIELQDGSEVVVFQGSWDGQEAVIARQGNRLDVTLSHAGGIDVITFDAARGASEQRRFPTSITTTLDQDVQPSRPDAMNIPGRRNKRSLGIQGPPVIDIVFVLHKDTRMSESDFLASQVNWWVADMKKVAPAWTFKIHVRTALLDLETTPYGSKQALSEWTRRMSTAARQWTIPDYDRVRFVLVTPTEPYPGSAGVTTKGNPYALASTLSAHISAHELGHTFEAIHEDSETRYNGWWCDTNMKDVGLLQTLCRTYSKKNQDRIRGYLERIR